MTANRIREPEKVRCFYRIQMTSGRYKPVVGTMSVFGGR